MVFVAAAGNGGPDAPSAFPAAYEEEVIAVTAVDRNQRVYDQANRGRYIDVAAPGVRIWTALPHGQAGVQSGTSFAAPFVTAIVASIYRHALLPASSDASKPRIPEAVTLAHLSTQKSVRDDAIGLGLVTAPSNCAPSSGHKAPPDLPTATLKRWETRVDFAFSRAAN
jgi:subtilisin family serine protease